MEMHDVPEGFPRDTMHAVVSGTQRKLCAVLVGGVYVAGQTDTALHERWFICEDLAKQLVPVVHEDGASHPQHATDQTLERVRRSVAHKDWVLPDELTWLAQRLRTLLGS